MYYLNAQIQPQLDSKVKIKHWKKKKKTPWKIPKLEPL